MNADIVENVRRHQALGDPAAAEAMQTRLERQRPRSPKMVVATVCPQHQAHGFQADCYWCRKLRREGK